MLFKCTFVEKHHHAVVRKVTLIRTNVSLGNKKSKHTYSYSSYSSTVKIHKCVKERIVIK
jgi:hypothetical protein